MPTVKFQLRRDTAANWVSVNPLLGPGEPALETDTLKVKYGNGANAWNDLPYASIDLPAILEAYASGAEPSAFTLSIVDAADAAGWRAALELGGAALETYDQELWTPSVTTGGGPLSSYTAAGEYTRIGSMIFGSVRINIAANGSGGGNIIFSLPVPAAAGREWVGQGREDAAVGGMLQCIIAPGATAASVVTYGNGYPGGTGYRLLITFFYRAAD